MMQHLQQQYTARIPVLHLCYSRHAADKQMLIHFMARMVAVALTLTQSIGMALTLRTQAVTGCWCLAEATPGVQSQALGHARR